ncbi:hypothetical protein [Paenibacillus wynnii]|uniref:Uncharacterized protein n=1 Tax=Paenibacillus wynnii TaxID=268407 RepID=A0A098M457_9BACL|nr:hypothetical protein [Paenibacillus wynnii]KGE16808.1 hypothetical protein PWYN_19135 [Paenibacillus wynnii]
MSEFSESYHLLSNNQQEGVSLLQNAGIGGFVFPETNNWVTLLPEGDIFELNNELISHNPGVLLHYIYAEDHGWSLSVFEGTNQTFHYECTWEEEVENNYQEINKSKIIEIMNRNPSKEKDITAFEISKYFKIRDQEELFELIPAYRVAELIGLSNFEWISYEYMEMDQNDNSNPVGDKGIIIVNP